MTSVGSGGAASRSASVSGLDHIVLSIYEKGESPTAVEAWIFNCKMFPISASNGVALKFENSTVQLVVFTALKVQSTGLNSLLSFALRNTLYEGISELLYK